MNAENENIMGHGSSPDEMLEELERFHAQPHPDCLPMGDLREMARWELLGRGILDAEPRPTAPSEAATTHVEACGYCGMLYKSFLRTIPGMAGTERPENLEAARSALALLGEDVVPPTRKQPPGEKAYLVVTRGDAGPTLQVLAAPQNETMLALEPTFPQSTAAVRPLSKQERLTVLEGAGLGYFAKFAEWVARNKEVVLSLAACLVAVVTMGAAGLAYQQMQIRELLAQIETAGVRDAMQVSISASGRDTVAVEGSFDVRYIDGATLKIREEGIDLAKGAKLDDDGLRKNFNVTLPVDLYGQHFTATVEFHPKPEARELGEWFGEKRTVRQRDFLASYAGLIADPKRIRIPAELTQIAYMPDEEDGSDLNRYLVAGRTFEQVQGMHGWLVIDPAFGGNMFVGSSLSLDGTSGSPFMGRCFLGGSGKPDGEPFRLFCVFSKNPDALRDGQELPRNFNWTGFVRTPSKYKINDGTDGFDAEQETPPQSAK